MVATEKLRDSATPATGSAFFSARALNPLRRWPTRTEVLVDRISFIFTKFSRYAQDNVVAITNA
jgi:hypothetical protein